MFGQKKEPNGLQNEQSVLLNFDFRLYNMDGACSLIQMGNGKYEYYVFIRSDSEDPGIEYYFSKIVVDHPISDVNDLMQCIQGQGYTTFNKKVISLLVKSHSQRLINKAIEFDAEVYGDEYRDDLSYRPNEPWSKVSTAVEIAKNELESENRKSK